MSIGFNTLFERGGILMIPLVICSIVALTVIFERCLYWFVFNKKSGGGEQPFRGLLVLETIVTLSPLLGILGTILGVIQAFSSFGLEGKEGLIKLSEGISEALLTTAYGLVTASVGLVFYNLFTYLGNKHAKE